LCHPELVEGLFFTWSFFVRSFVLKQKNQKFKNAGSPPGGILPAAPWCKPCKFPYPAVDGFLLNASFKGYFSSLCYPKC
jgi:hypothetical protein